MDHAPFIWWSYGFSAVVLLWTAVAPMLRGRRALANLRHRNPAGGTDDTHA